MYSIPTWYVALLATSAGTAGLLAAYLTRFRGRETTRWLCRFLLGVCGWSLAQILILLRRASGLRQPGVLDRLGLPPLDLLGPHAAAVVSVIALLLFALEYAGYGHLVSRRTIAAVVAIPAVALLGAVTNGHHHLFWAAIERTADLDGWRLAGGPLLWLNFVYGYLVALCAAGLLAWHSIRAQSTYRWQAITVVLGVSVPFVLSVGWFAGLYDVDLTEVGFTATGVALWIAVVRYELGDVVPIARRQVVDQIDIGVVVTDTTGRIVDVNPAAERLLGSGDGPQIGQDIGAAFRGFDDAPDRERLLDSDRDSVVELSRNGRILTVERSTIDDNHSESVGRVLLVQDVTERRQRQSEIERQNERLDRFASMVSHDLRNPLSVATGSLELAREDTDDPHLDRVANALDRMETLIDEVLTWARSGRSVEERSQVELDAVADQAWRMTEGQRTRLVVEVDRTVVANRDSLQQLFENLFRNAVEHGGDTVIVGGLESGFYVADDGPGIPPNQRERIFESGYSTADKGTGFGLAIVKEIVDTHGWEIEVAESELGGARFEIAGVTTAPAAESSSAAP